MENFDTYNVNRNSYLLEVLFHVIYQISKAQYECLLPYINSNKFVVGIKLYYLYNTGIVLYLQMQLHSILQTAKQGRYVSVGENIQICTVSYTGYMSFRFCQRVPKIDHNPIFF